MLDEGYIKYQIDWQLAPPPAAHFIEQINTCRNQLYQNGLNWCLQQWYRFWQY
jgi:hypothetical protein